MSQWHFPTLHPLLHCHFKIPFLQCHCTDKCICVCIYLCACEPPPCNWKLCPAYVSFYLRRAPQKRHEGGPIECPNHHPHCTGGKQQVFQKWDLRVGIEEDEPPLNLFCELSFTSHILIPSLILFFLFFSILVNNDPWKRNWGR